MIEKTTNDTTKILFIGDPHLDSMTPVSRADNYREVTLGKLDQIKNICIENNIKTAVFSGDMFSTLNQSLIFMNQVIDKFNEFQESEIEVLTLIGNHDLPRNNMSLLKNTPIYTLLAKGVVKRVTTDPLVPYKVNDYVNLYGIDYTYKESVRDIVLEDNKVNLLIMHYATDNTVPADNIPYEDYRDFDLVFSGHDHHYYPTYSIDKTTILRPGSMTRTTREKHNVERDIIVNEVQVDNKLGTRVIEHRLDIADPDIAFRSEALADSLMDFYSTNYGAIFKEEFFSSDASTLSEIIDRLPETVYKENKEYYKEQLVSEKKIKKEIEICILSNG